MRIKHMGKFVSGAIQLIIGVGLLITCICLNRFSIERVMCVMLPTLCGIGNIIVSIETKAERQKRKAELRELGKLMFGGNDNE